MKIQNQTVVTLSYDLYVGEGEDEALFEQATEKQPMTYCHGENMMLPKFEEAMAGHEQGDQFEFRIGMDDAYGVYEEEGVMTLPKSMFEIDGKFDDKRVQLGNVIPMNTADGQIVNALVTEITDNQVTIDLNHPLAGENLRFVVKVLAVREATPAELEAIRHPHCGGGCSGSCNGCQSDCGGCQDCE